VHLTLLLADVVEQAQLLHALHQGAVGIYGGHDDHIGRWSWLCAHARALPPESVTLKAIAATAEAQAAVSS
jgi:hypothetical protein